MNNPTEFPVISPSFIKHLEEAFPLRDDFHHSTAQNALIFYYGQRSVVRFLKEIYRVQNETILTKD